MLDRGLRSQSFQVSRSFKSSDVVEEGMASAVRRSHTSKWKDSRRGSVGLRVAVYGGFILCICFLLIIYELLRYGYLSSTGGQQKQEGHRIETGGQKQKLLQFEHYNRSSIHPSTESVEDSVDRSDVLTIAGTSGEGVEDDDDRKDKQDIEVSQDDTEKDSNQARSGNASHGKHTVSRRTFGKEEKQPQREDKNGDVSQLQDVGEISKGLDADRLQGNSYMSGGALEEVEGHGLLTSSKDDVMSLQSPRLGSGKDGGLWGGWTAWFFREENGLQEDANDISLEGSAKETNSGLASIDDEDRETPGRDDEDGRHSRVDDPKISELPVLNQTSDDALLDGEAPIDGSPQGLQRLVEQESGHQSSADPPIEVRLTPDMDRFAERGEQGETNSSDGLSMNEKEARKVEPPVHTIVLQQTTATSDASELESDRNLPRVIVRKWKPPKHCGTAEEMGSVAVGDTRAASLRVRSMIKRYILEHGAERVRSLPAEEFCKRGFSLGQGQEDGFGNNMYKVLTGAGLAIMLNRSLIIGERGALNPTYTGGQRVNRPAFGDYLEFSNQSFTMREVKVLWAVNGCNKKYKRPLVMYVDNLEKGLGHSRCLCDDWTTFPYPIIHFKGATNTAALQFLLKNAHPAMRAAAAKLLGNPSTPSSRPNTFGELFRAFISPNTDIQEAVQWALKGGVEPDVSLHLRMLHSHSKPAPASASSCVRRIIEDIPKQQIGRRRPRVVVVTDTPAVNSELQRALGQSVEVIRFNYLAFLKASSNLSEVISLHHGEPPRKRVKDWGGMPRWVAMVDFFLAARARLAVVSGAYRRVSTTYAQLVASLAAAYTLEEENGSLNSTFAYYSSFQPSLVSSGLSGQSGWGHTWRPFGGRLGCRKQAAQCARTPLLPYAWWDAPWQSPILADIRKLQGVANIDAAGQVSERHLEKFCAIAKRRPLFLVALAIPVCTEEKPCR